MGAGHLEASVALDKAMPEQVHLTASVPVVMSVTAAGSLEGLWPKGKSVLEKAHLGTSVAVLQVMQEYPKVCGCG